MQQKFPNGMSIDNVFDMYSNTVYRLAYARVGNKYDAEDVLQTVFLKLCKAKMSFGDAEHLVQRAVEDLHNGDNGQNRGVIVFTGDDA